MTLELEQHHHSNTIRCEESDELDRSVRGLETLRESERIIAFTDAVIAVAITLLILPLMEFATGEADSNKEFFRNRSTTMCNFLLSFVIIIAMWIGHDVLFSRVSRLTPLVTALNFIFMLCVVWIPVATALTKYSDRTSAVCYALIIFTTRLLLAIVGSIVRRDPRMWEDASRQHRVFGRGAEVRSWIEVATWGLAGLLVIFGPLSGSGRYSFYFIVTLKWPIILAFTYCFPALMTDVSVIAGKGGGLSRA